MAITVAKEFRLRSREFIRGTAAARSGRKFEDTSLQTSKRGVLQRVGTANKFAAT
jgi:hypothetical protein